MPRPLLAFGACTGAIPSLVEFDRQFRERGLTLIGIHTPEFPPYAGEHGRQNLARALRKHQITYPNPQDNEHATWDSLRDPVLARLRSH